MARQALLGTLLPQRLCAQQRRAMSLRMIHTTTQPKPPSLCASGIGCWERTPRMQDTCALQQRSHWRSLMKCSAETSRIYVCESWKEVLLAGDHACWAFGFLLALVLRVLRSWHHSSHRERRRAAGAHASLAWAQFDH